MTAENNMNFKNLKLKIEENIGTLTLSRLKALNALNTEVLLELKQAIDIISKDETIHVLIITGDGKAFVAGADIAEMMDLDSAKIGLVNKVVPADQLMNTSIEMAKKIASKAQLAIRYSKMVLNKWTEADIESITAFEHQLFAQCFATEDQKEGMAAFVEKRQPRFKVK